MWIDLHAHNITRGMTKQHPFWGPFIEPTGLRVGNCVVGTKQPLWVGDAAVGSGTADGDLVDLMSAPNRLATMDRLGMDKIVVNNPSHMYMYWTEPEFGVPWATTVNNELAEYCTYDSDRMFFWAHAPLQDPAASVKEIERAVTQLGAKGLSCGGANFGGLEAYSPELFPVWEKLCELDVPIFVHGYNQAETWGDQSNTDVFDTTSILGMNSDETKFFWYLINGGALDHFPELKVYITHGGGFVPYQLGRFAATNKTMAPDSKNKKPVDEYRENFYFDIEVHAIPMRNAILDVIGADHLLYGDNFNGGDSINWDLTEGMDISEEDREKIKGGNAQKLLRL
jgi:predicted TIM-barrel fold metal-dependent hydrolase